MDQREEDQAEGDRGAGVCGWSVRAPNGREEEVEESSSEEEEEGDRAMISMLRKLQQAFFLTPEIAGMITITR